MSTPVRDLLHNLTQCGAVIGHGAYRLLGDKVIRFGRSWVLQESVQDQVFVNLRYEIISHEFAFCSLQNPA